MKKLSHYDSAGRVSMVDIGGKEVTERRATARAFVAMSQEVLKGLPNNPKGDPLEIARISGITGQAHRIEDYPTDDFDKVLRINLRSVFLGLKYELPLMKRTGGGAICNTASVAALTIYDMTKALDKAIEIRQVHLVEKSGGKSGTYRRSSDQSGTGQKAAPRQ